MTEYFIKLVKENFEYWAKEQEKKIKEENKKIELDANKKKLENTLYDFLKNYMSLYEWNKQELKQDKYPIYCFLKSQDPIYDVITGKRICDFRDLYWNLQNPGYSFGPSDYKETGTRRKEFIEKNIHNIIYPPKGESFWNKETFYKVQAEFVEESLKNNQEEAKKLMLRKYGINYNKR